MIENFKVEEAMQARQELAKRLATLGAAVTENVKLTANSVIADTLDVAESRVKSSIGQINPRAIIRENPLASVAGAFLTGLVLTLRSSPVQRRPSHPMIAAATALGFDLLRAYAMSQINRHTPSPRDAADSLSAH